MKLLLLFMSIVLVPVSYANSAKMTEPELRVRLDEMTTKYRAIEHMKSKVQKIEKSELLDMEKVWTGFLDYSKGQVRINFSAPDKLTLIVNDSDFWQISEIDKSKNRVINGKIATASNVYLDILTGKKGVFNQFNFKSFSVKKNTLDLEMVPKEPAQDVTNIKIKFDLKRDTVKELTYIDTLSNSVTMKFDRTRFLKKAPKGLFTYKIKPKDEVSNL